MLELIITILMLIKYTVCFAKLDTFSAFTRETDN